MNAECCYLDTSDEPSWLGTELSHDEFLANVVGDIASDLPAFLEVVSGWCHCCFSCEFLLFVFVG